MTQQLSPIPSGTPVKDLLIQARVISGPVWCSAHFGPGRWVSYEHANFTHHKAAESIVGAFSSSTYVPGESSFQVQTRVVPKTDQDAPAEVYPLYKHTVIRSFEITVNTHNPDIQKECHDISNHSGG